MSDIYFGIIFLAVCGLSFHSIDNVFYRAEAFNFNKVQLINNFFHGFAFNGVSKRPSLYHHYTISERSSSRFFSILSSRNFIILYFTFKSVIYFELIFAKSEISVFWSFFLSPSVLPSPLHPSLLSFCLWLSSCFSTIGRENHLCSKCTARVTWALSSLMSSLMLIKSLQVAWGWLIQAELGWQLCWPQLGLLLRLGVSWRLTELQASASFFYASQCLLEAGWCWDGLSGPADLGCVCSCVSGLAVCLLRCAGLSRVLGPSRLPWPKPPATDLPPAPSHCPSGPLPHQTSQCR